MSSEPGSSKSTPISSSSFDAYNVELQTAALNATKISAGLPSDISFHRAVDGDFAKSIDSCSGHALNMANKLLSFSVSPEVAKSSRSLGKRKLEDQEDVVERFQSVIVDILDQLFERADTCLDDHLGRAKVPAVAVKPTRRLTSSMSSTQTSASRQGRLDPTILHASHLKKPQLKFGRREDNSNDAKWYPSITHKYNAQVPLGYIFHSRDESGSSDTGSKMSHPYRYEIEHMSYPDRMFKHEEPILMKSFEETPFTWIETKEGLEVLLGKLRASQEIAVDLEHHSYRSFAGFLCLMQISTREEDFIIDTLALREELEELNEVFTDPRIVKVFHGAESDIVWLQQNFNIYVVNLFDTYHASKVLDFPKHGLATLLTMYCDYVPDKRYQLADWRIRRLSPLPTEMLLYARSDTHFLLYIYDNLRNALLDRVGGEPELVRTVLSRSEETAFRTYEKEVYDFENGSGPGGWETLMQKWNKILSGIQLAVFRCVHGWRDQLAREEDESTRYVLPNHYLFQLAEHPPADMAALLSVFRPVPPLVRTKAASLLDAIRNTIKEHLSQSEAVSKEGDDSKMDIEEPTTAAKLTCAELTRVVPSIAVGANPAESSSSLWSRQNLNTVASTSSLLESDINAVGTLSSQHSVRSTLFPSGWANTAPSRSSDSSLRYREVLAKVHGALAVAPPAPKVEEGNAVEYVALSTDETSLTALEQIEIPFVPPAKRMNIVAEVEDSIVMVGQQKQKKRKRVKQATDGQTEGGTGEAAASDLSREKGKGKSKAGRDSEAIVPFDFASAPNMLDTPESAATPKPLQKRAKKGRTLEYGNFPAPPRAFSEVKGGNKSHTFR